MQAEPFLTVGICRATKGKANRDKRDSACKMKKPLVRINFIKKTIEYKKHLEFNFGLFWVL